MRHQWVGLKGCESNKGERWEHNFSYSRVPEQTESSSRKWNRFLSKLHRVFHNICGRGWQWVWTLVKSKGKSCCKSEFWGCRIYFSSSPSLASPAVGVWPCGSEDPGSGPLPQQPGPAGLLRGQPPWVWGSSSYESLQRCKVWAESAWPTPGAGRKAAASHGEGISSGRTLLKLMGPSAL